MLSSVSNILDATRGEVLRNIPLMAGRVFLAFCRYDLPRVLMEFDLLVN
jgi:hypothetical protein